MELQRRKTDTVKARFSACQLDVWVDALSSAALHPHLLVCNFFHVAEKVKERVSVGKYEAECLSAAGDIDANLFFFSKCWQS